jgi:hypothetical protein
MRRFRRLTGDELDAEWLNRIPDGDVVPQPGYRRWAELLAQPRPAPARWYFRRDRA